MKRGLVRISQILLLLSIFSLTLPITLSENTVSNSRFVTGKEIRVSPGNTTIHYVYFDFTEGRLEPFLLLNITISEPGWYHLEIWIDMFNPSDKEEYFIECTSEGKTYRMPGMLRPYLIHWPIDMIEFLITDKAVYLGAFYYTWGFPPFYLSAKEYRKYAMYIIVDFEAVKPGIIECSLWDTSRFFLERLINNEFEIVEVNVTEVKPLDEDEIAELPKFPEPPQPPVEFDIVVYANGTTA